MFRYPPDTKQHDLGIGVKASLVAFVIAALMLAASAVFGAENPSDIRVQSYFAQQMGLGSGTVIGKEHDIAIVLTCHHNVRDYMTGEWAQSTEVVDNEGRKFKAGWLGGDAEHDLALVFIRNPDAVPTPIAGVVDSKTVWVSGFSHGERRRVRSTDIASRRLGPDTRLVGGAIVGESGGGVFDSKGYLVGVVNATNTNGQGGTTSSPGAQTIATCGEPVLRFVSETLERHKLQKTGWYYKKTQGNCYQDWQGNWICPRNQGGSVEFGWSREGPEEIATPSPQLERPAPPQGEIDPPVLQSPKVDPWRSAIEKKLDAVDDRLVGIERKLGGFASADDIPGDYVKQSELNGFVKSDELDKREAGILDKAKDLIASGGPAVGKAAAGVAVGLLGLSGPAAWLVLLAGSVGGGFVGWRLKRRFGVGREIPFSEAEPAGDDYGDESGGPTDSLHVEAARVNEALASETAATFQPVPRDDREARQLLQLSRYEGRDPLLDATVGRLALDRLDTIAESNTNDPNRRAWADELRRELRERFNEIAPTNINLHPSISLNPAGV